MESRLIRQLASAMPAVAFFAVFYLCLWKWVEVSLIYHGGGHVQDFPAFYWGWEFAREFRTHPGGLVEYGSALIAQAMYFPWFGALTLTAQAALLYVSVLGSLRSFGAKQLRVLAFVAPLLCLAIYCRYRHFSAPVTSFTLGAVSLWAWLRLIPDNQHWRLASAFLLAVLLYAAAPSALLVFVPGVFFFQLHSKTQWPQLLVWLCLTSLLPWFEGAVLFGFARGEAYGKILPLVWDPVVWKLTSAWIVAALYALVPLLWLAAALWHRGPEQPPAASNELVPQPKPASQESTEAPATPAVKRRFAAALKWAAAATALLPILIVYLALNPQTKAFLKVDYFAWHDRWPEVLTAARSNPRNTVVACTVVQANYHLGKLTRELPTLLNPADLLLSSDKQLSHWRKSDLYFDLGYLNMALHHLTESVEFYGERPLLLQRLALVNLALGNINTARVYLGTLARAPFQRAWARDYETRLEKDPTLAGDEEVGRLRRLMSTKDSVVAFTTEEELLMLLSANRQNRMAFEYLMTYYLLTKNLNGFVKNISRVQDFSGFEITPLWDEALVLASRLAGRPVQVPGHIISQEAIARVDNLTREAQQYGDNADLSRRKLSAAYGRTYAYYWLFHL
ncbi:MAG TPA: DUF6057 family protein [Candidatus Limnocylindrales bacterium]|nr:DUF6057 family protein [Candidatus Limnocylindrales bacterium]